MKKIFGAEDSLLYADNNTSWANDLALELRYDFEFLYFQFFCNLFSIATIVVLIFVAFWPGIIYFDSNIMNCAAEIFDQK